MLFPVQEKNRPGNRKRRIFLDDPYAQLGQADFRILFGLLHCPAVDVEPARGFRFGYSCALTESFGQSGKALLRNEPWLCSGFVHAKDCEYVS